MRILPFLWFCSILVVACRSQTLPPPTAVLPSPTVVATIVATTVATTVATATATATETAVLPPPTSSPTAVPTATETAVLSTTYYLLSERLGQIIEVDPAAQRTTRRFDLPLPAIGNSGPEGLTFLPNAAVSTYNLFGLPPSAHGGYFVVSVQADGQMYVVELPLDEAVGGQTAVVAQFHAPGLEEDAAALAYHQGFLWAVSAKEEQLFQFAPTIPPTLVADYSLKRLPYSANDTEGLVFGAEPGVVFLADDKGGDVSRYDNFPACLADESCVRGWKRELTPLEPSGLAWDADRQQLLVVGDGGELIVLDATGGEPSRILTLGDDLEGVAVVVR